MLSIGNHSFAVKPFLYAVRRIAKNGLFGPGSAHVTNVPNFYLQQSQLLRHLWMERRDHGNPSHIEEEEDFA